MVVARDFVVARQTNGAAIESGRTNANCGPWFSFLRGVVSSSVPFITCYGGDGLVRWNLRDGARGFVLDGRGRFVGRFFMAGKRNWFRGRQRDARRQTKRPLALVRLHGRHHRVVVGFSGGWKRCGAGSNNRSSGFNLLATGALWVFGVGSYAIEVLYLVAQPQDETALPST